MNCEKCKNKKATVFYADRDGERHSLCASCAAILGKLNQYSPSDAHNSAHGAKYTPEPSMLSLCKTSLTFVPPYALFGGNDTSLQCPICSTHLSAVNESGSVGCPECYNVFGEYLFPSLLSPETAVGARIPSSLRTIFDRQRAVSELKLRIKDAIESENYELAAELRDKIKSIEARRA